MKIVVIGGSGCIGEKLVYDLRRDGRQVLAASPSLGVNTITREGLEEALEGAAVVVDVSNSPSLEGAAPLRFGFGPLPVALRLRYGAWRPVQTAPPAPVPCYAARHVRCDPTCLP